MPSIRKALALSFAGKYSALAIHTVAVMVLGHCLAIASRRLTEAIAGNGKSVFPSNEYEIVYIFTPLRPKRGLKI